MAAGRRTLCRIARLHCHGVPTEVATLSIKIAGIDFDNVFYDRECDVLYMHVGEPSSAADFDASPEGHALRFDAHGRLVGITLLNPRWLMSHGEPIVVTLPQPQTVTIDPEILSPVLSAA